MDSISLDAAEVMTGISRRTLWRRVAEGVLVSTDKDARGRTMLALDGLLGSMQDCTGLTFSAQNLAALCQADAGNAQAQADVGAWLYAATAAGNPPPPESRCGPVLAASGRRTGGLRCHALAEYRRSTGPYRARQP